MSLDKLVKSINLKNLKYPGTDLTYEQILKKELHRFKDILQKHIDSYYSSYSPKVYVRGTHGGNLRQALSVDEICETSAKNKTITCKIIVNENAIHNSIFNGGQSNAFWLINDGWSVKKDVWFKDIYRLGHYEGADFIGSAITEFETTNTYGIKIDVVRPLLYY